MTKTGVQNIPVL